MSNAFSLFADPIDTPEEIATRQEFEGALQALQAQALITPDDDADHQQDQATWCVEWPQRVAHLTNVMNTDIARRLRLQIPPAGVAMLRDADQTCQRWLREQAEAREHVQREQEDELDEENRSEAMQMSEPESPPPVVHLRNPRRMAVVDITRHKRKRVETTADESKGDDDDDDDVLHHGSSRCSRCTEKGMSMCRTEAGRVACRFCSRRRQGCSFVSRVGKVAGASGGKGKGRGTAPNQSSRRWASASATRLSPDDIDVTDSEDEDDSPRLRSRVAVSRMAIMKSEVDRWTVEVRTARANHQAALALARHAEHHLKAVERGMRRARKALHAMATEQSD
ncbi:hypothetical protein JVU11DRAFT_12147 [Chiua virens]|nr:hypothetical protein JVU11DRAFT_12147 [Chiua virens]